MKNYTVCFLLLALSPGVWAMDTADQGRLAGL